MSAWPTARPGRSRSALTDFEAHPFLALWEVTQACNLACVHCRASATQTRDRRELTLDEGKQLLERFAAMGTPLVVLTGGDPAKRPDLVDLVEHGVRCGLSVAVTPSGTPLFTRELMEQIRHAGASRVAVSVDGPDEVTHDGFRRVKGCFAQSMRILREARELGLPVQVNTSLGPHNRAALRDMAALVQEHRAVLWSVFVVVPVGRAGPAQLLGPRLLERLLEELWDVAQASGIQVKTTAAPQYRRVALMRRRRPELAGGAAEDGVDERELRQGPRGIGEGNGLVFVSHVGEIYPSGFLPLSAGNVRSHDIVEVYRHHPMFKRLRDPEKLRGKCGACPFKRICGGSRARAYAHTGELMAEDPLCAYVPRGFEPPRAEGTRS